MSDESQFKKDVKDWVRWYLGKSGIQPAIVDRAIERHDDLVRQCRSKNNGEVTLHSYKTFILEWCRNQHG